MLRIFIKRLLGIDNNKKLYKTYNLDKSVILDNSASIYCFYGSTSSDIQIGKEVQLCGELLSEYNGKIVISDYCSIGRNSTIRSVESVFIGELTMISTGVVICDNNNHPVNPYDREIIMKTPPMSVEKSWKYSAHAPIVIGRNCWIGENSRICKGVHIGEGAIVAANAVVTKDVPAFSVAAGNPARIVKTNIDKEDRFFSSNK